MLQLKAKVVYNNRVKERYFLAALEAPQIARIACPGQFVNIRLNEGFEPLLRRPVSIHGIRRSSQFTDDRSQIEILYEVVGKGTEILSQKKPGEYLDIIGPLGNGFEYNSTHPQVILAAGGMGVAPLVFLAQKIKASKKKVRIIVLLGFKNRKQILCEREFRDLGCQVMISTEDGSRGFKGYLTDLLDKIASSHPEKFGLLAMTPVVAMTPVLYGCGPKPMLKQISLLSGKYNIPAQVSLEEHMACGIGACLGCVVETTQGFKRVCKEGPVFNTQELIWPK